MNTLTPITQDAILKDRVQQLKLYGLLAHWDEIRDAAWLPNLVTWEEKERLQRGFDYRLKQSHLEAFKRLAEFDWAWPTQCDRACIETGMRLDFIKEASNILLCGPCGVGKTTIASNLGYEAIRKGYTVLFITASEMLNDLSNQEGYTALQRRLKRYTQPALLICDKFAYHTYSNRHTDLLFEIVSRRYEEKSIILTTNKSFSEWGDIFPNKACVVSLIDRLVHHSEIITLEGKSYRLKEAQEKRQAQQQRKGKASSSSQEKEALKPSCDEMKGEK